MWPKVTSAIKNRHFLSLAGNGTMSILGMLTSAIIYRQLPMDEAGKWFFFQATFLLIDTFRSGFLTTAFIKFYAGTSPQRAAEVVGSTWFIGLSITVILALLNVPAFFATRYVHDEGLLLFLKWFGLGYIVTLPSYIASCIVQGEQRFDQLLWIRAITQGGFIGLVIVLVFIHKIDLTTVMYAYLASNFIASIISVLAGWSKITLIGKRTKGTVKELYNFGKYSVGTTLSSNMFRTSDTYIINFLLGPAALAVYNLGGSLIQVVEIPLRSFTATCMPLLSAAYNQNKRGDVIEIMKRYTGMLTVMLVPAMLFSVFVADYAISLIGGGKYVHTEAANVFRLFMTFALLFPADRFFALTLDMIHRPQVNFYKVLIMLAANVIFDFVGIWVLGNVYGVTITSVIPTIIAVVISFYELNKYKKFNFLSVYSTGFDESKLLVRQGLKAVRL